MDKGVMFAEAKGEKMALYLPAVVEMLQLLQG